MAYLRRILVNLIRDEIRRASRKPATQALEEDLAGEGASPLEALLGKEALEAYEAAVAALPEEQQEAVVLRIELGFTYQQVAEALGSASANSARMLVARALVRLAEDMHGRG